MSKKDGGEDSGFARRLREIRKSAGLNQTDFAKAAGRSLQTISRYERGELVPDMNFFVTLKEKFAANIDWLLVGVPSSDDLSPEEREIITLCRSLDDRAKNIVFGGMKSAAQIASTSRPTLALVVKNDAPSQPPSPVDGDTLAKAITLIDLWVKKNRSPMTAEKKAAAAGLIYAILLDDSDDNQNDASERIERVLRLVVG